jgi:hypothetical protein
VQHGGVQHVALDPLAAVDHAAQRGDLRRHRDAQRLFDRLARAHDVGDRADAADPRGDVGRVGRRTPAQQRLEEAGRLEDAELDRLDLAVAQPDVERPLALDPRQRVDPDRPLSHHRLLPPQRPARRR